MSIVDVCGVLKRGTKKKKKMEYVGSSIEFASSELGGKEKR